MQLDPHSATAPPSQVALDFHSQLRVAVLLEYKTTLEHFETSRLPPSCPPLTLGLMESGVSLAYSPTRGHRSIIAATSSSAHVSSSSSSGLPAARLHRQWSTYQQTLGNVCRGLGDVAIHGSSSAVIGGVHPSLPVTGYFDTAYDETVSLRRPVDLPAGGEGSWFGGRTPLLTAASLRDYHCGVVVPAARGPTLASAFSPTAAPRLTPPPLPQGQEHRRPPSSPPRSPVSRPHPSAPPSSMPSSPLPTNPSSSTSSS